MVVFYILDLTKTSNCSIINRTQEIPEKYENNPDFQEFLNREFNDTAMHATMEELAEFAFGSIDAAIKAFEARIKNES